MMRVGASHKDHHSTLADNALVILRVFFAAWMICGTVAALFALAWGLFSIISSILDSVGLAIV